MSIDFVYCCFKHNEMIAALYFFVLMKCIEFLFLMCCKYQNRHNYDHEDLHYSSHIVNQTCWTAV